MSARLLERFERTASALASTTVRRTRAAAFDAALGPLLTGPAVGVPLPFPGVSLDGHPVTLDPSPEELLAAEVGVTPVGPGVAEYGSVVVRSGPAGTEPISLFPRIHVAVLPASALVATLKEALEILGGEMRENLTGAVITTGPSATADMGAPVYGAHGPDTLHILVVEDR